MASPNRKAAALARRTPNNSAICVLGNTLALYSPATRVAEEFAIARSPSLSVLAVLGAQLGLEDFACGRYRPPFGAAGGRNTLSNARVNLVCGIFTTSTPAPAKTARILPRQTHVLTLQHAPS
jgi:hypothetical protein